MSSFLRKLEKDKLEYEGLRERNHEEPLDYDLIPRLYNKIGNKIKRQIRRGKYRRSGVTK